MRKLFLCLTVALIVSFPAVFILSGCKITKVRYLVDLAYGEFDANKLDLAVPDDPELLRGSTMQAILYIHGGGWNGGDKGEYERACKDSAKEYGIFAATMNYRMFDDGADCDIMLADIHKAIDIMKQYGRLYDITVNGIALIGYSAGAHLALLYSYKFYLDSYIPVAFCAAQAPPADFTDSEFYSVNGELAYPAASRLGGKEITAANMSASTETLLKISPVNYVTDSVPPTLIAYGLKDPVVPPSNALRLKSALEAAGAVNSCFEYPSSGHGLDKDKKVNEQFETKLKEYINIYLLRKIV